MGALIPADKQPRHFKRSKQEGRGVNDRVPGRPGQISTTSEVSIKTEDEKSDGVCCDNVRQSDKQP